MQKEVTMKVIKRDGRAVDYDRAKIELAIEKANNEVREEEKASKTEIKEMINYIESLNKKRMLVEDIQDIIEQKLMEIGRYELAKKYIVYRYTRALVRKANTTDETILGLIRNMSRELSDGDTNKNTTLASAQRDFIAGEVSRDLTQRLLLPEKIVKAHKKGILYFHDAGYFVQPIINSCLMNISDMLKNGTVINGIYIESPQNFLEACMMVTQIIATVASNQYGATAMHVKHLGNYLKKSYEICKDELENKPIPKELKEEIIQERVKTELQRGVKILEQQINTLMTAHGNAPEVTLILQIEEGKPYTKENAMIIEEILKQRYQGVKNEAGDESTPEFPKLVYVLDECNAMKGGRYDYLTKLAMQCSAKRMAPQYVSAKRMKEMGIEECQGEGHFSQGIVSINLPQIAMVAEGDETIFWKELDKRLELCFEALMCKHYTLLGTSSQISPIHWQQGAIARLEKGEKIDKLLYKGHSTISLGYIGIYEMTKLMKGVSQAEGEGHDFAIKVLQHLKDTVERWTKETNIAFTLYGTPAGTWEKQFTKMDKEQFGTVKEITDKGAYTNSFHIDTRENMQLFDKLTVESKFQAISTGGSNIYIETPKTEQELTAIIQFIYDKAQYATFLTQ